MTSFDELSSRFPAPVGVAIASIGTEPVCFGEWTTGVAWSTSKVPLAVAAVRAGAADPDQLAAAITRSDNGAAEQLWTQLGESAAQRVQCVIREAGDSSTEVEARRLRAEYTPFGQTQWSLADQARFGAGLSGVADAGTVIALMRSLCDHQRWGLARQGFAAKGGWGPGLAGGYLVRQVAVVSATVGVALAAEVGDGGYRAGVDVLDTVSDWLVDAVLAEY